ncbi:response regulator [Lysinibacillus sp. 2017]|uniref:response regulator n=1 Tax=unclassified Lysinibacillus TaxID=2636778 RepID=UPI000D5284ED|nr:MULTISPECIES: response regulator [unclassified Lysinibacillus]AWE06821.1 response regulator [Lysinibacillus sp. 2017]TGN37248.1 response regulator [Lysinibacillus sp. S2017]
MKIIQVLLVEDDPMVREVNRQFIERVDGFKVIDMASDGIKGIEKIKNLTPDLVVMDIFMPEQDGIETLRQIRNENLTVDCISVTAANDVQTIQQILHLGVFDYIMKPFTFERMEQTLIHYRQFKEKMDSAKDVTQAELDEMIGQVWQQKEESVLESTFTQVLPKGFNRATMDKVLVFLKQSAGGASADDVASGIGVARVTARRYLDYMEKSHLIHVDIQYGSVGRPINQYFIKE